jgi:hypothetical protein
MSYVDLRPNRVRPVQVMDANGQWVSGLLEVYSEDLVGWRGYVRFATGHGSTRLDWFTQDRVRQPSTVL